MDNTDATPAFRLDHEPGSLSDLLALAADAMKDQLDRRAETGEAYPLPEMRAEWGRALAARVAEACRPFWLCLYAGSPEYRGRLGLPDHKSYDGLTVEGFAIRVLEDLLEEHLHRCFYPQADLLGNTAFPNC